MEEVSVLIGKSQSGDKEAREVLIEKNLGLVHHIVKRFLGRGYDPEDLFQIGVIGLMKAIDKFDLKLEVRFSTYAVPMITGEIKRFLRDDGLLKVSRTIKEDGLKVRLARQRLQSRLHREPTLQELSEEAQLDREDVILAMEAGAEVESLYRTVNKNDENSILLIDKIEEENSAQEELLNRMVLRELLTELSDKDREIIVRRYYYNETQSQIATRLGISQVQVSRLEKKILKQMREKI